DQRFAVELRMPLQEYGEGGGIERQRPEPPDTLRPVGGGVFGGRFPLGRLHALRVQGQPDDLIDEPGFVAGVQVAAQTLFELRRQFPVDVPDDRLNGLHNPFPVERYFAVQYRRAEKSFTESGPPGLLRKNGKLPGRGQFLSNGAWRIATEA